MPYVFFGEAVLSGLRGARHGMMSRNPAELSAAPMFRGERDALRRNAASARRGKAADALSRKEGRKGEETTKKKKRGVKHC